MADHDPVEARERIRERPEVHTVTDKQGGRRDVNLSSMSAEGDVSVDAYTESQHPDNMGYRRSYNFRWDGPRTLTYTHTTVSHGPVPAKKRYPCPEIIRELLVEFFNGRVSVESDHGFNQAHQNEVNN